MEIFGEVDWREALLPQTPLLEIVVRGTVMYLGLVVLLRLVLRRQTGGVSVTDLLVIVLLADASQNAMSDDYVSIADGLLLVVTILGWSLALNWLGYRTPLFERLVHPPPLPLVEDGRLLLQNMRRELITEEELWSMLREQGVEDLATVRRAYLEGDGRLSVLTGARRAGAPGPRDPTAGG